MMFISLLKNTANELENEEKCFFFKKKFRERNL